MNEVKAGLYRHFKGNLYEVLGIPEDATDGRPEGHKEEEQVVYRSISTGKLYKREVHQFLSKVDRVKYPGVTQHYRFERIGD